MSHDTTTPARVRWARLRFAIIGPLLSAPAEAGDLAPRIEELAARAWRHPSTGDTIRFSAKSIERWYYAARNEQDPIRALERKVPKHAGTHASVTAEVAEAIRTLRKQHPRWSYQLVHDNLVAVGREQPELGVPPGYATVSRFMKHHGLGKHRRPRRHEQEPGFVPRERRLFEVAHVPLRVAAQPRVIVEHHKQGGRDPVPAGAHDFAFGVVEIAVPQPMHVGDLEEPPLTRDESRLLLVSPRPPVLAESVVLHEAGHRRVARQHAQLRLLASHRHQIVVHQLVAPSRVLFA